MCNRLLACVAYVLLCAAGAASQTSKVGAILEGTVTDSSGAAMPQASVALRNAETNQSRETVTDQ
jgi:hypothetical protein